MWSCKSTPNVYNPPPFGLCYYMELYDFPYIMMKHLMGKYGKVFKDITHQVDGLNYIWYNPYLHNIEIWGNNTYCITIACKHLIEKINSINLQRY